jgi:hypothetical protein
MAHRQNLIGCQIQQMKNASIQLLNTGAENCGQLGFNVLGTGQGQPCAPVTIYSANCNYNGLTYNVDQGGWLLVRNAWYEADAGGGPNYLNLTGSGTFTLDGSLIAYPRDPANPGITLNGFQGQASFISTCVFQVDSSDSYPAVGILNDTASANFAMIGSFLLGSGFLVNSSPNASVGMILNNLFSNSGQGNPIADSGQTDNTFLLSMLAPTRAVGPINDAAVGAGLADVHLHRVGVTYTQTGFIIRPGSQAAVVDWERYR